MKKKIKEMKKSAMDMENLDLHALVKGLSDYVKNNDVRVLVKDITGDSKIGFEALDKDGKSVLWNTHISNIRKQRDEVFSKEENDLISEYHAKRAELDVLENKYIKVFTSK